MRPIAMRELVLPPEHDSDEWREKVFKEASDILLNDDKHGEIFRDGTETYIDVSPEHQRAVLLSALTSATKPTEGKKISAGKTIAVVGCNMGTGEHKFIQTVHSSPNTSEDIRRDIGHTKYNANVPFRPDLFDWIKKAVPEEVQKQIAWRGEVRGYWCLFCYSRHYYDRWESTGTASATARRQDSR